AVVRDYLAVIAHEIIIQIAYLRQGPAGDVAIVIAQYGIFYRAGIRPAAVVSRGAVGVGHRPPVVIGVVAVPDDLCEIAFYTRVEYLVGTAILQGSSVGYGAELLAFKQIGLRFLACTKSRHPPARIDLDGWKAQ